MRRVDLGKTLLGIDRVLLLYDIASFRKEVFSDKNNDTALLLIYYYSMEWTPR